MIRARGKATRYAQALPAAEGWPAFLIVVDVGHVIELYSEFTRQGKTYVPFPDPQSFRIKLPDLADASIRQWRANTDASEIAHTRWRDQTSRPQTSENSTPHWGW